MTKKTTLKLLATAITLVMAFGMLSVASFAAGENDNVIVFDGSNMAADNQLIIPTIEDTAAYRVTENQWYLVDKDGNKTVNDGTRVLGNTYAYRLTLEFSDPNAYPDECNILLENADWRWNETTQEAKDGKRVMTFEGTYHAHQGKYVAQKDATCTEDGTITHWVCACGCHTSDELGLKPIYNEEDMIIKALGHDFKTVAAVDATCDEAGVEGYLHCDRCGKDFDADDNTKEITAPASIPAIGHKDENSDNKCDVCDKELKAAEEPKENNGTTTTIIIVAVAVVVCAAVAVAVVLLLKKKNANK